MTYEHVAILPFLIDDVHLSPADVAERAENPIAWASRRYGQPEHVFRAAAERLERRSRNAVLGLSPTTYTDPLPAPSSHARSQSVPSAPGARSLPDVQPRHGQDSAPFQPQGALPATPTAPMAPPRPVPVHTVTNQAGPSSHNGSTASSYFSTILSSDSWPEEMDVDTPEPPVENREVDQPRLMGPPIGHSGRKGYQRSKSVSTKGKDKMRAHSPIR